MQVSTLISILFVSPFALALAIPLQSRATTISVDQILEVSPKSSTCIGATPADQCRTAAQAAPFIAQALGTYGITTPGEVAAVIADMAWESGDFKMSLPYKSDDPGQGTRNMQSGGFNLKYAVSIPALLPALDALSPGDLNGVRKLLTSNDTYDFGSAAWFLSTQCSPEIRSGLQSGSVAGYQAYVSICLHTPASDDRQAYWDRACKAFGACIVSS